MIIFNGDCIQFCDCDSSLLSYRFIVDVIYDHYSMMKMSYLIAGKYPKLKLKTKMNEIVFLNDKKAQLVHKNFKYQEDARVRKDGSRFYKCVE